MELPELPLSFWASTEKKKTIFSEEQYLERGVFSGDLYFAFLLYTSFCQTRNEWMVHEWLNWRMRENFFLSLQNLDVECDSPSLSCLSLLSFKENISLEGLHGVRICPYSHCIMRLFSKKRTVWHKNKMESRKELVKIPARCFGLGTFFLWLFTLAVLCLHFSI